MEATGTIPIITVSADPVGTGFVASLSRPRANVTGLALMYAELSGKRLELLTQVLPRARRVACLLNPANPSAVVLRRETDAAARALGIELLIVEASTPGRLARVMAAVAKMRPDALIVSGDPLFWGSHQALVGAVARQRLPAM